MSLWWAMALTMRQYWQGQPGLEADLAMAKSLCIAAKNHAQAGRPWLGATRLVPFVESNAADWLANGLKGRLTTLRADIASVSDFATHLSEKLQFLLDATLGFISIAQNDVMKVMTIASVAGIPPVLVAGIYGMNFKAIPELEWSYGYAYAWALILLTTLVPIGIFWWRKWI